MDGMWRRVSKINMLRLHTVCTIRGGCLLVISATIFTVRLLTWTAVGVCGAHPRYHLTGVRDCSLAAKARASSLPVCLIIAYVRAGK
jgi:hypothetical protein